MTTGARKTAWHERIPSYYEFAPHTVRSNTHSYREHHAVVERA
jgi:hypothetical protein